VPVGDKAFFEGRLVHTNELLVLLGENYFARRTATQTLGIIERRLEGGLAPRALPL
jgi:unconventional prefoldin RPB5 interactor 1